MYWEWSEGRPRLRRMQPTDPSVTMMTQGASLNLDTIKQVPLDTASRVLGVYLCPSGDFSEHLRVMKTKADLYSIRL